MPPYSDNLYSADDSGDELSPTDGYFENRGHPQDMMVEDPSIAGSSTAESKAQEARRDSEARSQSPGTPSMASRSLSTVSHSQVSTPTMSAAYASSSPRVQTPRSPRRPVDEYTEGSSLLHAAPPPAYSPPTPASTSPPVTTIPGNYNTISSRQAEEGRVSHREPESMGGPPTAEANETTPLWRKRVKVTRTRGCIRGCLFILLILTIFVCLLTTLIKLGMGSHGNLHHGKPAPEVPSHDKPTIPGEPGQPHPGSPDAQNYCQAATIHRTNTPVYEFSPGGALHVFQRHKDQGSSVGPHVQTNGRIIFRHRKSEDSSDSKGVVTFNIWTTDESLSAELQFDPASTIIKAYTPQRQDGLSTGIQHCISVEMTVWLPSGATFEEVKVYASQLGIEVFDDFHIHVSASAGFETVSGNVHFPAIDSEDPTLQKPAGTESSVAARQLFRPAERGITSREVRIHTASGAVSGAFSLYDLLSISTVSGNIDISAAPQDADKHNNPAVLELDTKSGNIYGRLPVYASPVIPKRDYHTTVGTTSGWIKGSYYIGAEASFTTVSALIQIDMLPGLADGKSNFNTKTTSGNHEVEILPTPSNLLGHYDDPEKWIDVGEGDPYLLPPNSHPTLNKPSDNIKSAKSALTKLHSSHSSKSGTHKILYPSEWEGTIEVGTTSGGIKVGGEGVRILRDGRDSLWMRKLVAEKGSYADDKSTVALNSISGSTDIFVGPR